MTRPKPCRFIATDQPRAIRGEHERDCNASACAGCKPCPETHCQSCGHRHLTGSETRTCATCVGTVREDLADIDRMTGRMLGEAVHRGIDSEAAMLAGPVANPETWWHQRESAEAGRIDAGYLDDCRDEQHPLWVLGTWEMLWREHLGHATDRPLTVGLAVDYLGLQLSYMAQQDEPDFEQFAREVRGCRGHLEDVLRDGEQIERGAPCPMCGTAALVKRYGATEAGDRWVCPRRDCRAAYTEHDYRTKVDAVYVLNATALTASQIRAAYRVPEGSTRGWASNGKVRRRGKDQHGRQLYDVADTLAMRDKRDQETA